MTSTSTPAKRQQQTNQKLNPTKSRQARHNHNREKTISSPRKKLERAIRQEHASLTKANAFPPADGNPTRQETIGCQPEIYV